MIGLPQQHQVQQNLQVAFNKCGSTNNDERKMGQAMIQQLRSVIGYPVHLITCIQQTAGTLKCLRAAIQLKLWTATFKAMDLFDAEQQYPMVDQFKAKLLDLCLSQDNQVSAQLNEAISNIAAVQFPRHWPTLMTDLISKVRMNQSNITKVVSLMALLTFRYSYSLRSDPLYEQIIKVCDELHDFLYQMLTSLMQSIMTGNHTRQAKDSQNKVLRDLLRLYYNLNYQDLHPLFQDNLNKWMALLKDVMTFPGQDLSLLKAKSEAMKCILLFAMKYRQDIKPLIQDFSEQIWQLCGNTKADGDVADSIQMFAIKYFKNLVSWPDMKPFFAQHLQTLLQILIFPYIGADRSVQATLTDEPAVFIGNYFENSDIESIRSVAIDLLKGICRSYKFDEFMKKYVIQYLEVMRSQGRNIPSECMLLNLAVDAGYTAYRSVDGATSLSFSQDIVKGIYLEIVKPFFADVYPWILNNQGSIQTKFNLMHLVIHLRYIYFFRLYIPREDLLTILTFCSSLTSQSQGFRTIVCLMVEALIGIRFGDYHTYNLTHCFTKESLKQPAINILKMIFTFEEQTKELSGTLTQLLFNLTKRLEELSVQYTQHYLIIICNMLKKTERYEYKNVVPIFETLGMLIFYTLKSKQDSKPIEQIIDMYFDKIRQQESDLLNFIFQLYGLIVKMKDNVPQSYVQLCRSIMKDSNWSVANRSLFNAYVQFIVCYMGKFPQGLINQKVQIEQILSRLIQQGQFLHFFHLLSGIMEITHLDGFFTSGYMEVLMMGTTAALANQEKRVAVLKMAVIFYCKLFVHYDPIKLMEYTNRITPGFVENLMTEGLSIVSLVQFKEERKYVFMGISTLIRHNLLTTIQKWATMLNALIVNTDRRSSLRNLSLSNLAPTTQDDSYQRLWVFTMLQAPKTDQLVKDQERFLVDSFKFVYEKSQNQLNIKDLLPEKSQEQLTRLIGRYNK